MWLDDDNVYNPKQIVYDFSHADVPDEYRQYIPLMERLEQGELVEFTDVPHYVSRFLGEYYFNLEPHVDRWYTHVLLMTARPHGAKSRYHYLRGLPTKLSPSAHKRKVLGDLVEWWFKIQIFFRTMIAPWIG